MTSSPSLLQASKDVARDVARFPVAAEVAELLIQSIVSIFSCTS